MDPDRKQQTNLNDEDDNFITEYKQEVIHKPWSKTLKLLVAITTLILAVVGTLASFKAASLGNQVVTTQNEAFNHWSNYQAKTIKKTTLETELYTIEIELAKLKDTDNALKTELLAKKAIYEQEIAQYKQEEITLTAKAQEAEQRHLLTKEISTNFGNALIFLQIGILLSSLTTLSKIKYYWYIGSISGIIGFSIFITSYYRNLTMYIYVKLQIYINLSGVYHVYYFQ